MAEKANEIGLRLKCLELAVLSIPHFEGTMVHELALKYQYFIQNNEWPEEKKEEGTGSIPNTE